jgi:hypothetical protein
MSLRSDLNSLLFLLKVPYSSNVLSAVPVYSESRRLKEEHDRILINMSGGSDGYLSRDVCVSVNFSVSVVL